MDIIKKYSWAAMPEPISENEIAETVEVDAVICGAGMSGCAAALSAAENGLKTVLLEKGNSYSARGYHFGVADSRLMREKGITNDIDAMAAEWIKATASRADEDLIRLFLNRSGEAMDWLMDKTERHGIGAYLYGGIYRGEYYKEFPGAHIFDCAADGIVRMMIDEARNYGASVHFSTAACCLEQDADGNVIGVIARNPEGRYIRFRAAKGVVLATGDIVGNREMMEDLCPIGLRANNCLNEHAWLETGDGHKMGIWAGGELQDGPLPCSIHMMAYSLFVMHFLNVDRKGRRFGNEDSWTQGRCVSIIRRDPAHPWAYLIMDSRWEQQARDTLRYGGGIGWDFVFREWGSDEELTCAVAKHTLETALEEGKSAWSAESIAELALKAGIPAEELEKTVARYNELAVKGHDDDYGKRPEFLAPICKPPYYAMKIGGSLLTVFGGLNVDRHINVVRPDKSPIKGLYAIGNVMGGLYAVDYPLLLPGNSHGRCICFGYLVGRELAGLEG